MNNPRILLVAGHSMVRLGFRTLLATDTGKVVGTASSALEAESMAMSLHPDIVVLDSSLPDADELKALNRIACAAPSARVIFLSDRDDEEFVEQALISGASCYLLKQTAATDLCLAIHAAQKGREYFSPALIQRLRNPAATIPEPNQLQDLNIPVANKVEARLLALFSQGLVIRQLAQELRANIDALRPALKAKLTSCPDLSARPRWRWLARRLLARHATPHPANSGAI